MQVTRLEHPYVHYCVQNIFDPETATALRGWAERSQDWRLRETSFYSQFSKEIYVGVERRSADLSLPIDLLEYSINCAEHVFDVEFRRDRFEAHAHRFEPGQGIGIHNDWPIGGTETHRIVVHLNPDYHDSQGGHLVMYSEDDPATVAAAYRPLDNMAIAFPLGRRSWHSVAEVQKGRRHSIVFSFWETSGTAACSSSIWSEKLDLLIEAGARTVPHTSRTLFDHLKGVAQLLEAWGCDETTIEAGLFHSVYGTASFDASGLRGWSREELRSILEDRAERLVYAYATSGLSQLIESTPSADTTALIHIHWANICEQARHELIGDADLNLLSGSFLASRGRLRPHAAADVGALLGLEKAQDA